MSRGLVVVLLGLGLALPLALDDEVSRLNAQAGAALEQGRPADAVLLLEAAVKRRPDDEVLTRNLAWAHYQVGEIERAHQAFERAMAAYARARELWPEEPAYGLHLASLQLREFRLEVALESTQQVLERHPEVPEAQLLAGDCLALLDRLDEAAQAYHEAARLAGEGPQGEAAQAAAERVERELAVEADYVTTRSGQFVVRAPAGGDHLSLLGVLERARVEVAHALGSTRDGPVLVVLYPPDAFRAATGVHEWVGGLFDRKIRLPSADPKRDGPVIEAAFRHEYTHLLVSEWSPRCPTFLNEGLAQTMEFGRGGGLHKLVEHLERRGLSRDEVPSVSELPASFMGLTERASVELGYLTSYAFVDHVAEQHGLRAVVDWIHNTDSAPVGQAFERACGRSLDAEQALFDELLRTAR